MDSRNQWCRVGIAVVGVLLGFALQVLAQEEKMESGEGRGRVFGLENIVVTTARGESAAVDAAQSVSVITSDEIMASPFERVEDIVRAVPGVYNYRHYGHQRSGIQSPLSMRGVGKNRVLILVDGVPQNDIFNNSISWVAWGQIPKESIERIEVVRGPSSALYGSEALGGVINVITKTAGVKRTSSLRLEGGAADTYGGHGFHSQTFGDVGFVLSGGYEESDGFYMLENPAAYEIRRHRDVDKLFGKLSLDISPESSLSLTTLRYDHETGKGREFFYDELELNQVWLNYRRRGESVDFDGTLYLQHADKTAYQDSAKDNYASLLRREEMSPFVWGADIQTSLSPAKTVLGTFGLAFKNVSWDYDDIYENSIRDVGAEGSQRSIAPFANMDMRFFDETLILTAGARYDWVCTSDGANWDSQGSAGKPAYDNTFDSDTFGAFSPKLGLAWHLDERTTLRASAGKGFRAPSLFELYKVHVRQGGAFYREANPDLDPEEIWSFDLGAERFFNDNLWGRISVYRSFADDYIGDRTTGTSTFAGGTKTRYDYVLDNISKVDIYGVESEVRWFAAPSMELFANYTYNVSTVAEDTNNAALEGNALPNDPRHAVHAGATWRPVEKIGCSVVGNYYADMYFDNENTLKNNDSFTMDISISWKLRAGFSAYMNIENLFDEEYVIFRSPASGDTLGPGRIVLGGLKWNF